MTKCIYVHVFTRFNIWDFYGDTIDKCLLTLFPSSQETGRKKKSFVSLQVSVYINLLQTETFLLLTSSRRERFPIKKRNELSFWPDWIIYLSTFYIELFLGGPRECPSAVH